MTFTLADVLVIIGGMFTVCCTSAGILVFMYSKFITREEAVKMEKAVDRIIASFKGPIYEKLDKFEVKLDRHLDAHHD